MNMSHDEFTREDVSRLWPVVTPVRVRRIVIGSNNRSFIVDCNDRTYFLKRYDNVPDRERSAFGHRLTAEITAQHPPFAVPETIRSRSGETHVLLDGRSFTLSTFISGSVAAYGDPDDAAACGKALGDLHLALAGVDPDLSGEGRPIFGNLAAVHPLVPDPEAAIREAVGDEQLIENANAILSLVQSRWDDTTTGWPLAIIHGDFYPSNVLMESHRVTGVVDFEFAGVGHRTMDLAIGLYAFAFGPPDMGKLTDRFMTGYLDRVTLSVEEIAAIPALILMREATSLIHRTGRSRQGLSEGKDIEQRASQLVDLAAFLTEHGAELVNQLNEISSRSS